MDQLSEHVQNLPAELYNEVYNLVFTAAPGKRDVQKEYRPPALLQVDRKSRRLFSKTFYGADSIFVFHSQELMYSWLSTLNRKHRTKVKNIHYSDDVIEREFVPDLRRRRWRLELRTMRMEVVRGRYIETEMALREMIDRYREINEILETFDEETEERMNRREEELDNM